MGLPGKEATSARREGATRFSTELTEKNAAPSRGPCQGQRKCVCGWGGHVATLTRVPGPRAMDPSEMSAVSCCPTDSSTALDTRAPWGIKLRPRRAVNRCARCHNHGATDQIKDHKHLCLFQTCKCRKCARFS